MKIFFIGFMGCGKSHWGKLLSHKLQLPFFDLDEKVEEQEGQTISEIFEQKGEEYFRLAEKDALHLITESHEAFVMACGGGTPCYYNNIDYLKKQGTVVWINSTTDCLYQRLVKEKLHRPMIRDIPDEQLKSFIIKKYSSRKIFYQQAQVILPGEVISMEILLNKIFHSNA